MSSKAFPLSLYVLLSCLVVSCNKPDDTKRSQNFTYKEEIKWKQYYVKGEQYYQQHCSNCHKLNGEGLAHLIPPLKETDFLQRDTTSLYCIIKYGLKGEVMVNNVMYNQPMPGNPRLTDLEIAEISTYLYSHFFGKDKLISASEINKALKNCE